VFYLGTNYRYFDKATKAQGVRENVWFYWCIRISKDKLNVDIFNLRNDVKVVRIS